MKSEKIYLLEGREDVWLKTYLWEDSPQLLSGKRRPAVMVLPGGGYLQAGDNEGEPTALKFASMGYHAFVLHYSIYELSFDEFYGLFAALDGSEEQTRQFLEKYPPKKECRYPAPILDVGRAFLKIREMAEEWLVDMDRIALCGFSAGAHNAAMYGASWGKELLTRGLGCDERDLKPAALILSYPVTDYGLMNEYMERVPAPIAEFFRISNQVYTGSPIPEEEMVEKGSPARLVEESFPPTFLWAGANDALVPVQNTLQMATSLAEHQIPFEVHIYENADHGIGLGTQASASSMAQVFEAAGAWSDLAGAWLKKRFALPL